MKLLIITQKVDKNDPTLGFFHNWITDLAKRTESIKIICLEKGFFNLPQNVVVYSLGKEEGLSKASYIINFFQHLFSIHGQYNKVFVHMNQEYVLLAGLYWKLKRIPVYLWRNHPKGNILTRLAIILSTKVFCTSTGSFTARFKKTIIMPAGIDTAMFKPKEGTIRKKYSVCMVGRVSPVKHVELGLSAINQLVKSSGQISMTVVGSPGYEDAKYYEMLQKICQHS